MTKLNQVALAAALSLLSSASLAVSIDLTGAGSNGGGYGNSLTFNNGGISVTTTGWGATGSTGSWWNPTTVLETAEIYSWSTGLGVCNQNEGSIAAGTCRTSGGLFSSDEHQVDNSGADDFVLFVFNQEVVFDSITIDPFNSQDTDVSYAVATVGAGFDLDGQEPFSGLFSGRTDKSGPVTTYPQVVGLDGVIGNALVVSGLTTSSNDAFKIQSVQVSAIPVPASAWLFVSGLAALVVRKRTAK